MADQKKDELQQIANLVIDAYVRRNESFVPVFENGTEAVIYLSEPKSEDEGYPSMARNLEPG